MIYGDDVRCFANGALVAALDPAGSGATGAVLQTQMVIVSVFIHVHFPSLIHSIIRSGERLEALCLPRGKFTPRLSCLWSNPKRISLKKPSKAHLLLSRPSPARPLDETRRGRRGSFAQPQLACVINSSTG